MLVFEHGMYGTTVHFHKVNQVAKAVRNAISLSLQYIPMKRENCVKKNRKLPINYELYVNVEQGRIVSIFSPLKSNFVLNPLNEHVKCKKMRGTIHIKIDILNFLHTKLHTKIMNNNNACYR